MRIQELKLKNFGPFKTYTVKFAAEDNACVLLTGKNNEGKSSIITGLRLLDAATRVIAKVKYEIRDGDYYRLLRQDTDPFEIGRMVHNYESVTAEIQGRFADYFTITVFLDPAKNLIYADYKGTIPDDIDSIFGFMPPLGPLSEQEDIIAKQSYLKACLNTSLAPRHLRNHLFQLLNPTEFKIVKDIISSSWSNITLLDYEIDYRNNRINCFFKEGRIEREIAWAGQGLQVWFQIITHLVRLRQTSILILDEPEINLHPEKQNDLIRIIRDHYNGSVLIATHSVELMNNVSISHIINVQKAQDQPQIKCAKNRTFLEMVRSQIGSNFNLIASQFEDFDLIIFTEDASDFSIIQQLASKYNIGRRAFNIPIHGFSENKKSIAYKNAYKLLIGKSIDYSIVLDRDYYPKEHLESISDNLAKYDIKTIFTIGKEIENLFLRQSLLDELFPSNYCADFGQFWDNLFVRLYLDSHASYITLYKQFLSNPHLDTKTLLTTYTPQFDCLWQDKSCRNDFMPGKEALKRLRAYYRKVFDKNLTQKMLIDLTVDTDDGMVHRFVEKIYHVKN